MTLVLGIQAADGIVIAADTQETVEGYWKGTQGKIRWLERLDREHGEESCMVSAAGRAGYADALMQRLLSTFRDSRPTNQPRELRPQFEETLSAFNRDHVAPYNDPASLEIPLILAYQRDDIGALWLADRSALSRQAYTAVGIGWMRAREVMKHTWKAGISVNDAVVLAAFASYDVKHNTDGVGDYTDICYISNNRLQRVERHLVVALETLFEKYATKHEPAMLRHLLCHDMEVPPPSPKSIGKIRDGIRDLASQLPGEPTPVEEE